MKARQYAQAIYEVSRGKDDSELEAIAVRSITLLRERGFERLLPFVLHELERLIEKEKEEACTVRVAETAALERHSRGIQDDMRKLGADSGTYSTIVDDTLIGGYEIRANGHRIDRTYKRRLLNLHTLLLTVNNIQ